MSSSLASSVLYALVEFDLRWVPGAASTPSARLPVGLAIIAASRIRTAAGLVLSRDERWGALLLPRVSAGGSKELLCVGRRDVDRPGLLTSCWLAAEDCTEARDADVFHALSWAARVSARFAAHHSDLVVQLRGEQHATSVADSAWQATLRL